MSDLIQRENYARQELDTQISTAKAYPRNVAAFVNEAVTLATLDQETAESCIYALPRRDADGKQNFIKGESIRLAEIAASCWGNLHAGTRIVENDGRSVTAEGVAWDLEKNLKVSKQVKRSITNRFGKTYSEDMQVVTGNAASSIALRNAILSVIPRAFVKKIYEAAVNFSIGDQTKIDQKVKALFDRFKKLGIEETKILAYLKRNSAADIDKSDIEEMIGIGTAIKEKHISIDDAFVVITQSLNTSQQAAVDAMNQALESPEIRKAELAKRAAENKTESCEAAKEYFNEDK